MILDNLLASKKLKSADDLTPIERKQYDQWYKILTSELKVEDIEKVIRSEAQRIQDEWLLEESKNPFNYLFHWKKEIEAKARLKNYSTILKLITGKEKEKDNLVKYIKTLIK